MNRIVKALAPAIVGCLITVGAHAQEAGVPGEIVGYRNMIVVLSETAGECNLTDTNMFRQRLADRLAEIGINPMDDVYANVELRITAKRFGGVIRHCVTSTELFFKFPIGSANFVTSDEQLKATIDRMNLVQVIIYEDGQIGVQPQTEPSSGGPSTDSQKAVLSAIDAMVERLAARRM